MSANSDYIFIETQEYNGHSLKYIVVLLSVFFIAGLVACSFVTPMNSTASIVGIIFFGGCCFMLIVDIIIFFARLKIRIDEQGIMFTQKPSKEEIICQWNNIDQVFIRYYKHGIWGVRSSVKNGMAYNLQGKAGIQIVLKDGKKIQLGIQNLHEAKLIIEHHFKGVISEHS